MYVTKRQKEILDFITGFIQQHGYAPSLQEIGSRFGLSSLATVHKHLSRLEEKGLIRRSYNRGRSIELVPVNMTVEAVELPLLGLVAAGKPIEAVPEKETIAVPANMVGRRSTYVLQVKGDSMLDEQIRDGDYVVVEERTTAENGETVIALLKGEEVTLKKFYRENGYIRLQPANPVMKPIRVKEEDLRIQGIVIGVLRKY
jgi:repressor LexA